MAGTFEIYKGGGQSGGYRWRLKSRSGEIVASGESFETKADTKRGIAAVLRAAAGATIEDLTEEAPPASRS